MSKYIYRTKEGKFETNDYRKIPWDDLHSPKEETPALIYLLGPKEWHFEGKRHRLTGPAVILLQSDVKLYYLNGTRYNFKEWTHNHPNIDIYLEANGYKTAAEKAIRKLKNM